MEIAFKDILPQVVEDYYGVEVARIEFCDEGHSNVVCFVTSEVGERFVFRIEPPFVNSQKVNDFRKIAISNDLPFAVPRFIFEERNLPEPFEAFVISGYRFISGYTKYRWYEVPDADDLMKVADAYKILTNSLRTIDLEPSSVAFIERYDNEQEAITKFKDIICDSSIRYEVSQKFDCFMEKADEIIGRACELVENLEPQFVHNDFQMGNILFEGDAISGVLDFEDLSQGFYEIDAIFSAFRIAKSNGSETKLEINRKAFETFLNKVDNGQVISTYRSETYEFWLSFFALRESFRYMISAINKVDIMRLGIGFMPCFLQVANYNSSVSPQKRSLIMLRNYEVPDACELERIENENDELVFVQLLSPDFPCNNSISAQRDYQKSNLRKPFYIFPVFKDDIPDFRLEMRMRQLSPAFGEIIRPRVHNILPSADTKKRAVVITRAQPFHIGHLEMIERVIDNYDELIIVIASAEEAFTERNPLTAGQRMEIVRASIREKPYADKIWIFPVPCKRFVAENMLELRLLCPDFQTVVSTNPVHQRMAEYAGLVYDSPEVKSTVRATTIREYADSLLPIDGMATSEAENLFLKYF